MRVVCPGYFIKYHEIIKMNNMKASDLLVKCLESEDVEYIFGIPGEENADLMMSLSESKIKFVLTRHEQGAAFMADVYGRLTGKVGVCLATLGPGATNLVTGVANANMDRSRLLAITGQTDSRRLHKESHQNLNIVQMFEPIKHILNFLKILQNRIQIFLPLVLRKFFEQRQILNKYKKLQRLFLKQKDPSCL